MRTTAAALLPAVFAAAYSRGAGALVQVALAVCGCIAFEALCLKLRRLPLNTLADGSAAVAGIIIGLAMPPLAPWFAAVAAAGFAMTLAKHAYGGLGNNPFNPAMAGYALAFVSFPADFGGWGGLHWTTVFSTPPDAASQPTPLLAARAGIPNPPPHDVLFPAACVLGGTTLAALRIADWRLAAAFLCGIGAFSGGDWITAFSGATMLAAFFVITDPVTAAETPAGRILYGFAAGAVAIFLRKFGAHADGTAFAILFCNMLAVPADKLGKLLWRRH